MTLFLADMTGLEMTGLIGALVFGIIGSIVGIASLFKKTDTEISPQPLAVQLVQELHEQFADKREFAVHVQGNTARHSQLFAQIDEVDRQWRAELKNELALLNEDRRKTLEKLNEQFVFIRENISAIKTELKIRNEP